MQSRLIHRGWLHRIVEVNLSDGRHIVEYDGRGLGYESITVDGVVTRETKWYWMVPRFESKVAGLPLVVEVRVWPWLLLRSLAIRVKGRIVYSEGVSESEKLAVRDDLAD